MAIKKRPISPRQKMINLMYVVLMAMLALNTPTEEELGVKGKSLVEKVKRSLLDEPRKGDEKKDVKLVELNVSEMNAFVIPEKTTLYAGERFNSHVVMAAVDSTQRPEIYVNGSRLQAAISSFYRYIICYLCLSITCSCQPYIICTLSNC